MSKKQRYPEEFKIEAIRQVTERQHPVAEVAARLGVSTHSIYAWLKRYSTSPGQTQGDAANDTRMASSAEM